MRLATFNCNSIRTRLDPILQWLLERQPDIFCLQETKVQDKDFPVAEFVKIGYNCFFVGQKAYNGVAILTKEPAILVSKQLSKDKTNEARFLEIKYGNTYVINIYVPQGTSVESERFQYKLNFLDWIYEYINETHRKDEDLILTGDFNVALTDKDVYDPDAFRNEVCFHPEEQKRLERLLKWGLVDLYRYKYPEDKGYTFWDYRIPNGFKRNLGWRIDYILSTQRLAQSLKEIGIDKALRALPKPSDHTVLWAEFL